MYRIDSSKSKYAEQFVELPFSLYKDNKYYVPGFKKDMYEVLAKKHPFFEYSAGDFFLALRNGQAEGRIGVFDNAHYNSYNKTKEAHFYFFDTVNNKETAVKLFDTAREWAKKRGLTKLVGPHGFSGMDGGGILIDGFQHRAAMTMMNYNYPYYRKLVEENGFNKLKDYYSALLETGKFTLPEKIKRVVEISKKRGFFRVPEFKSKKQVKKLAKEIGRVYNESFVSHDDFCPLTEKEIEILTKSLILVSKPSLLKILYYKDEIAGFLFAFPDLSRALQKAKGRLNPLTILNIMSEMRKTNYLIINGAGILPKFQKLGGNAVLYYELEKTIKSEGKKYKFSDLTQIAETTTLMLKDLKTLGSSIYKTHRIYACDL
ncbi:MAG: hypothetical protein J7K04_05260 [Spirochaetales bacterium]|nr:hypothetical protein [Spirochaetales bacterium]